MLFYDAGQVRDIGERFTWNEQIDRAGRSRARSSRRSWTSTSVQSANPLAGIPLPLETEVVGETNAFKTSTGAEIRFFMPVLNVPFRLIFAMNPSRAGVLDNNLQSREAVQVPLRGGLDVLRKRQLQSPASRPWRATCTVRAAGDEI